LLRAAIFCRVFLLLAIATSCDDAAIRFRSEADSEPRFPNWIYEVLALALAELGPNHRVGAAPIVEACGSAPQHAREGTLRHEAASLQPFPDGHFLVCEIDEHGPRHDPQRMRQQRPGGLVIIGHERTEMRREAFVAHLVFAFTTQVDNARIPINPLGLMITYFREDQAFVNPQAGLDQK